MIHAGSPLEPEPTRWRGFDALRLADAHLEAVVVPRLGGRIVALVERRQGEPVRDWLWANPHLEARLPAYGESYVEAHDAGGFDECFPAVARGPHPAFPWQAAEIPDHGELVAVPWREVEGPGIALEAGGVRFPTTFRRTATLSGGTLSLAYEVRNAAPFAFPFVWCAHPLLATAPGMVLRLPSGHPLETYGASPLGPPGTVVRWPEAPANAGVADLATVPGPGRGDGWAAKLVGPAPARGWVGLAEPARGVRLEIAYDPAEVPHLGLWINHRGWSGVPGVPAYANLGLEPGIGLGDDLAAAHARGASGEIPPFGSRRFALHLRFAPDTEDRP